MPSFRRLLLHGMVLAVASCAFSDRALASREAPPLVPMPLAVLPQPGSAALGPAWTVATTGMPDDEQAVRLLVEEGTESLGRTWRVVPAGARARTIELRATPPPAAGPALFAQQGYRLAVTPQRVVIEAATPEGRFHGVQTFRQLLRAHPDGIIPCVRIQDAPALQWRGISDDISRGQISKLEDFKAIIRQLAYYKINLYQLYIEDLFQFEGAAVGEPTPGALSKSDLAELVEEGRRNFVVVTPIFETLAHQERLLSRNEVRRFAEGGASASGAWGRLARPIREWIRRRVLRPDTDEAAPAAFAVDNSDAARFVTSLADQIAAVTGGPFFHIGGDEWEPPARAGTVLPGGGSAEPGYGQYLGQVADHLIQRYGCRVMVYGDVILEHPEWARDLNRDVIVVDWQYHPQDDYPSLRRLRELGFRDLVASPGLWTWSRFYPNYAVAFANVSSFARVAQREAAAGCIAAAWEDDGAENLRENNWAGYAFAAAASWEVATPAPDADAFLRRFVVTQYGCDSPELVRAEKLLGWQTFDGIGWGGRLYHRPLPVRPRPQKTVERMEALVADMQRAVQDLEAAQGRVRFDRSHIAVALHCAHRFAYVAQRELLLDAAGRRLGARTAAELSPGEREEIVSRLDQLIATADLLEAEFGPLWLRLNQPEGLAANLERMGKQGIMLRRLRERALAGSLRVDNTYSNMQALAPGDAPADREPPTRQTQRGMREGDR
jgi:glycosyl hydrolase family 20